MAYRRSAASDSGSYSTYSNTASLSSLSVPPHSNDSANASASHQPSSPTIRKRQRPIDMHSGPNHPGSAASADGHPSQQAGPPPVGDDAFIADHDAVDSGGDDDDDDEKPKSDKKAGRRKIKIEFIQDKSRRHITFSKRKAGIMKKAYELSTLTGTQVLLLVVSETGLVYTFTTAKLQPLVTQPEGKNLIQACLNAPHNNAPSMPVGAPISRASMQPPPNLPGGLSIPSSSNPSKETEDDDHPEDSSRITTSSKRRRRSSTGLSPGNTNRGASSPHSPPAIPPLSIPGTGTQPQSQQPPPQISIGSPTSPQQQHQQISNSTPASYSPGSYVHHTGQQPQPPQHHQQPQHDPGLYSGHMLSSGYSYPGPGGTASQAGPGQLGGLAAAATQHSHWPPQQPQVSPSAAHYGRR